MSKQFQKDFRRRVVVGAVFVKMVILSNDEVLKIIKK